MMSDSVYTATLPVAEDRPRKRKSNFDVPPPLDGTSTGTGTGTGTVTGTATVDAAAAAKIAQAKAIAALLTAYPNTNSLASVTKYLPEGHADFVAADGAALQQQQQQNLQVLQQQPPYQRDEVYYARLDRAREKNINYVKRKDLEKLQKQARGEYEEPDLLFISKAPKQPRGNTHLKSGLGSNIQTQHHVQKNSVENSSIYVCGLSPDLTEKDLETLFSINGKIKKIKLYTSPDGRKKGDALVTFTKLESVALACLQYNNVDIGGGYTLQVTRASFKASGEQQQVDGNHKSSQMNSKSHTHDTFQMQVQEHQGGLGYLFNEQEGHDQPPTQQHKQFFLSSISSSSSGMPTSNLQNIESSPNKEAVLTEEQLLCSALPPESEVYDYPVALIQNAYDGSNFESLDVEFFIELEADMLEACCSCGRVRRLITPDHPRLRGSVAVTFEKSIGAQECFVKLNRRRFDSRLISVHLFHQPLRPPHNLVMLPEVQPQPLLGRITPSIHCPPLERTEENLTHNQSSNDVNATMTLNFLASIQGSYGYASDDAEHLNVNVDEEKAAEAAHDTEDFLNSLL